MNNEIRHNWVTCQALAEERSGAIAKAKVVGMGSSGMDYLAEVTSFPRPDEKLRTENLELQGGGNCGNALTAIARLGLRPAIISKIGSDSVGDAIINEFKNDGVDTSYLLRSQSGKSPFTYIIVDRETNTRTCIHTPGDAFGAEEMTESLASQILEDAAVAYFDGRLAEAAVVLAAKAYSLGIPILVEAERLRPGLDELLKYASFIVTSTSFPCEWTGKASTDGAMVGMMNRLPTAKWMVTTLGSRGALLLERKSSGEGVELGDVADTYLDGSLVEYLFDEASKCTESRTVVSCDDLCITSRSSSSKMFIESGSSPASEEELRQEARAAKEAAVQAARRDANGSNDAKYFQWDSQANQKSNALYQLTAIESANISQSRIVDTTGAGDAFIGSMVYSIACGMDPLVGCKLGSVVAACKCTKLGARPGLPFAHSIKIETT